MLMQICGFKIRLKLVKKLKVKFTIGMIQIILSEKKEFEPIIFSNDLYNKYVKQYLQYHSHLHNYTTLLKYALINNAEKNLESISEHL